MFLPFTIGFIVACVFAVVIYFFYEDILDGIEWLAQVNVRKQQKIWNRIVEMKREKEKNYE